MKIKNRKIVLVIIVLIAIIIYTFFVRKKIYNYFKDKYYEVTLTQLSNHAEKRQMMGYVLKTQNHLIVVDGGLKEDSANLIDYINKYGNGKVDAWFVSHPHIDHMEAFMDIVKNTDIPIDKVYVTLNPLNWYVENERHRSQEFIDFFNIIQDSRITPNVEEVELDQVISIDNLTCTILGVKNPEITFNSGNNSSMIIKFCANGKSFLFLGDTGAESGEKLLDTQGDNVNADIVQMSHHGQNGAGKEVYEAISPTICLWPTTEWLWNNDSGTGYDSGPWKTIETREWINEIGVEQNYIEKDGDVTLVLTKDGITKRD